MKQQLNHYLSTGRPVERIQDEMSLDKMPPGKSQWNFPGSISSYGILSGYTTEQLLFFSAFVVRCFYLLVFRKVGDFHSPQFVQH